MNDQIQQQYAALASRAHETLRRQSADGRILYFTREYFVDDEVREKALAKLTTPNRRIRPRTREPAAQIQIRRPDAGGGSNSRRLFGGLVAGWIPAADSPSEAWTRRLGLSRARPR